MTKFLRRIWKKHQKLGKNRKKKRVWRKPKGRHNKMREKRKGYPAIVRIGYKENKNLEFITINNIQDLKSIKPNQKIIVANVGKKKKIEIANKAKEMKLKLYNLNAEKFLRNNVKSKEKIENKKGENKK
jgi:large subunit ribosomal protein L32e